ncbi:formylglycine-generating enzyme family protein [Leptolyngbya sp. PL-A3]|uniref:formylglycine-generating enzyme family protein n=1 Tax=Leptolyngbya sp. PL-A3 TaxID=2933911 RepID=UPI0032986C8C
MVSFKQRQRFAKDPTEQRVNAFTQRYGRQATNLAAHAAFPLTLTTDVVYCLRESFLPDCPWYAAADVLLSGLCISAGHDLYEMDAATRRYLLRYLVDQFGEGRIEELERFMVAYLRHRLIGDNPDERALLLGEKPNWTALACLQPGDAYEEIRQTLEQLALQDTDPNERFRLASLVESYGDFLADRGYQPVLLEWADRIAEGEPIDETAEVVGQLQQSGFIVNWVDFEVATVLFGVEVPPLTESELSEFEFESVTVDDRGKVVDRQTHRSFYFEEPLGEGVSPLKMVAIPSGEFMMGSPDDEPGRYDDEGPQHRVTVSPFFMGQYPVTQAQWRMVATLPEKERELNPEPAHFKGQENCPVEQVSWWDAIEFCARISEYTGRTYRLPTEAEWEYACRAETVTPFHFGSTMTTDLANYDGSVFLNEPEGQSRGKTTPVGQFPPNAFGLYDMHGNVWEWCLDHWRNGYEGVPTDGSAWLTKNDDARRLTRGGYWGELPMYCRSACRINLEPNDRLNFIGFRVVCEA